MTRNQKPKNYWTKGNTIKEAREILEEFGEEAINKAWLYRNSRIDLADAIRRNGGFAWIRREFVLTESRRRPNGYWDKEKTIESAREVLEKFGERVITDEWLRKNGRRGLGHAISRNGGFAWIRQELGIDPDPYNQINRTPRRTLNSQQLKQWLRDLQAEGVHHLAPALQTILSQQDKTMNTEQSNNSASNGLISCEWTNEVAREIGFTVNATNTLVEIVLSLSQDPALTTETGQSALSSKVKQYASDIRQRLEQIRSTSPLCCFVEEYDQFWFGSWGRNTIECASTKSVQDWLEELARKKRERGDEIKKLYEKGLSLRELASRYMTSSRYIRDTLLDAGVEIRVGGRRRSRRSINIEWLKKNLQDLQAEGVHGLTPSQLVILLQQGGFDKLPIKDGKDIFTAVTKGSLAPKALFTWSQGDEPEPPIPPAGGEEPSPAAPEPGCSEPAAPADPPATPGQPQPGASGDDPAGVKPGPTEPIEPTEPTEPVDPVQVPDQLPVLAIQDADQQLRFLDCEVFAAADEEALEALTSIALHQIWAKAYSSLSDEQQAVEACRAYDPKRPWSRRVQEEFLRQHAGARAIQLPASYAFTVDGQPVQPRLVQRHVAFMAYERRRLLVLSDMGTGKSLAAQLAVMSDGAKRILVLPINACGHQWANDFRRQWRGVQVHDQLSRVVDANGRRSLALPDTTTDGPHVLVAPIHLLSLMDDQDVLDLVDGFCPDAVILDEVQFLKQRHDDQESARRRQAAKVLALTTEADPNAMVLALSGTAVVNNLTEAKKLLELTLCEERPDLETTASVANAMRMHQALMANGIRQRALNQFPFTVDRPAVDATDWTDQVKIANRYPARQRPLMVEKALIEARISAVIKAINGPTVVATQYVEGFIEPLREAIEAAGYSVGVHTGDEQDPVHGHLNAIEAFKAGAVDVLLASIYTLGTGVDGLQRVCSNLVIASMPWTAADYLQLIARLARSGQQALVTVTIPTTFIDYWDEEEGLSRWSFCEYRAAVIATKQRLMDAVQDGLVPDDEEITEAKAGHQLGRWLKRLQTTGALVRNIRPITVPLVFKTEAEELRARRHYGDFSSCNGRWNSVSSDKLHARLQRDPQEWELYHTDLEKLRLQWPVDPLQEAINWCAKSSGLVVGDFGCGTAQLAEALRGRHTVHSFDHIAINDSVVACDIAAGVPLEDGCLDLAVFSLSLMGPNWEDQLVEAHRCLKPTGQVLIWTAGSGKDPEVFTAQVEACGFKAVHSERHSKWLHIWAVRAEHTRSQAAQNAAAA